MRSVRSEDVRELALALLRELGEPQDDEHVAALINNDIGQEDWRAAAAGDAAELVKIRTRCGLPFTR